MERDEALQIVGKLRAMLRHAAREGVARKVVRVADVIDAGKQRAEMLAVGDDAADRDAAEIDAVIAALAADQADAAAVALHAVIGERDLQRRVDRLRAGIGEEHMVEALRRDRGQARGKLEHLRMAHLEGRRVVELKELRPSPPRRSPAGRARH